MRRMQWINTLNVPGKQKHGLIMIGAARRLTFSVVLVALLWLGYFWATTSPGGL